MTAPLDEKAIAQAHEAYAKTTGGLLDGNPMANAIRSYLSAVALPDELEGLLLNLEDEASFFDRAYAPDCATSKTLRGAATALSQANSTLAALRAERDEARQIVRDIHWMAVRYADGRKSYAPSMCNDALRKAYDAGWLLYKDRQHGIDRQYARDGDGPEWGSIEARAETAEAEVKRLTQALSEIRELNMSAEDENGHRWANSDLIEQTIVFAMAGARKAMEGGE